MTRDWPFVPVPSAARGHEEARAQGFGGQAPACPLSATPSRSPLHGHLSRPPSLSADVPKLEVLERELAWLKEHLSQLGSPVVFCHNDLLCKNIIYDSTKGTASAAAGRQGCSRGWSRDKHKETFPLRS